MPKEQPERILVRNEYIKKYRAGVFRGDIIWWKILEAENEQWTPAGTLDSIVVVNQHNGCICVWFNEFKAPGKRTVKRRNTGKVEENYRYEQRLFVDRMKNKPKIFCSVTDNVDQFESNLMQAMEL